MCTHTKTLNVDKVFFFSRVLHSANDQLEVVEQSQHSNPTEKKLRKTFNLLFLIS